LFSGDGDTFPPLFSFLRSLFFPLFSDGGAYLLSNHDLSFPSLCFFCELLINEQVAPPSRPTGSFFRNSLFLWGGFSRCLRSPAHQLAPSLYLSHALPRGLLLAQPEGSPPAESPFGVVHYPLLPSPSFPDLFRPTSYKIWREES